MLNWLQAIDWLAFSLALLLVVAGYVIAKLVSRLAERGISNYFSRHQAEISKRLIFYVIFLIFLITALQELGFRLSVLLGAAGIFTVAISFASQTAASNLISGIFLIFERPFKIGDQVQINGVTGYIETIDLLSTKLKSPDNTLIRIPNEALIKATITNMSYYPTRRLVLDISVAYDSDLEQVKACLLDLATSNPLTLKLPPAQVNIAQFADSAIILQLTVWAKTEQASSLKNELNDLISRRFASEGIEMPFPQLTLHQATSASAVQQS